MFEVLERAFGQEIYRGRQRDHDEGERRVNEKVVRNTPNTQVNPKANREDSEEPKERRFPDRRLI
jgi:hypothetical protein